MAEKLVSPGVFTEENDQTFLPQGIAQIAGVFVGPTDRGPAFEPVLVESPQEYREIFGSGDYYTDMAVMNYLQDADSAYVVRLLGEEGYTRETVELVYDAASSPGSAITEDFLLAVLAPTQNTGGTIEEATIASGANSVTDFTLELGIDTNDDGTVDETVSYTLSLNPSDNNYIADVFGTQADGVREVHVLMNFKDLHQEIANEEDENPGQILYANAPSEDLLDFEDRSYSTAETPWVQSQDLLPNQPAQSDRRNLFKFVTLSHGNDVNRAFKVAIQNVRLPGDVPGTPYGSFDVVVRDFDDSDKRPQVIEQYTNVNLNPDSPRYIARVIGNRYATFEEDGKVRYTGNWRNNSNYIRVEMNPEIVRANEGGRNDLANLVPWGFGAYELPIEIDTAPLFGLQTVTTQGTVDDSSLFPTQSPGTPDAPFDNRTHLGFDFDSNSNLNFLNPIGDRDNIDPTLEAQLDALDFDFSIGDAYPDAFGEAEENNSGVQIAGTTISQRKFIMGFQGGFDGTDPARPENQGDDITASNTQGFDCSSFDAPGTQLYLKAFGIMSNQDQFDINLLVTPGIVNSLHSAVVDSGIDMVEERSDAFYIFDCVGQNATVSEAANSISTIDSSYAGTYYPWVRTIDATTNQLEAVPPSVLMPRVYAFSDKVAAEWYAPAGLNRGGIPAAIEAVTRLTKAERDTLYDARVNPIAQFPNEGVVAWGQKTTQALPSALDRINVRRLLIAVKKFVASTSRFLVFEQNTAATRLQFLSIVNPFLEQIQQRNGLFAFRVKMDEENNPPEIIDRNILQGELFLQPARAAEFIVLDFNVLPTGAEFPE